MNDEADSKDAQHYFNQGLVNFASENYEEAIKDYSKVVELESDNHTAHISLGLAKAKLKNYEEAIADYTKAIELEPNEFVAYVERGLAEVELEKYEKAILDYTQAIERMPNHSTIYYNRGLAKFKLKKHHEAIADYTKAIELNPNDKDVYYSRAEVHFYLKNYDVAIDDYTKEIQLVPNDADSYLNRGNAKAELADYKGAIIDYTQVLQLESNHVGCYYQLTKVHYSQYRELSFNKRELKKLELQEQLISSVKIIAHTLRGKSTEPLYKYTRVKDYSLLSLVDCEVFFSDSTKLNDPLECHFLTREPWVNYYLESNKISPKILSLAIDNPENKLMYAHYADEHNGICIEWEFDYTEIDKSSLVAYQAVEYKDDKEQIESLSDLFMLKNKAWSYEQEFRFVRFDNESFMPATVKSITFALKCHELDKQIIYNLLQGRDIKYYQMQFMQEVNNIERVSVDTSELKVLDDKSLFKIMRQRGLDNIYHYWISQRA